MNRTKIEEKLQEAEKEYSSVMFLSDSKSFMKMKIAQAKIQLLTSLLAEDGGEVKYKSLAEHIVDAIWVELSDRSITNGIDTATEQEVVDSLIQIAEKELNFYNGASQHTKGEGV